MTSKRKLTPPPDDYDPAAPLTPEEIKTLRPAREWFAEHGIPMPVPRGRPKAIETKEPVTIRMSKSVLDYFKADGPGWQTRINEVLEREAHKKKRA
jgi:uncharacterized protein (DUF4415 family)